MYAKTILFRSAFLVGVLTFIPGCNREANQQSTNENIQSTDFVSENASNSDRDHNVVNNDQQTDKDTGDENDALREYITGSLVNSEAFASATEKQLKEFSKFIEKNRAGDESQHEEKPSVDHLIAADFQSRALRPRDLVVSFQDDQTTIRRMQNAPSEKSVPPQNEFSGRDSFPDLIKQLIEPMNDSYERRVKFKSFRVNVDEHRTNTTVYFHATGFSDQSSYEQNATWELEWTLPAKTKTPMLRRITCLDYEEAEYVGGKGTQFVDSTDAILSHEASFNEQLKFGIEHWRNLYPMSVEIDFRGHHGLAVGDINGDGRDDLFLCQPNGMPNLLYLQRPGGSLQDASAESGVNLLDESKSALILDFDNDGDQDLAVSIKHNILIYANEGSTGGGSVKLTRFKTLPGPTTPHSMSAADYDNDGDLDLFVCGFWSLGPYADRNLKTAFSIPTPFHDAENGDPNFMYRNDGELKFTDVTIESGVDQNNTRFSHAASWEDFDNDGDQDLYVANDFGRNNFYRNDNGKFVDVAPELGVEDQAAGMSVTWSDFNQDGWMDVYISNMFSAAGGRITFHRKFQEHLLDKTLNEFQRHSRGNTMFASDNAKSFRDVSDTANVVLGRWAWSSNFVDFNNDSWDDLFVANGFVTNDDTGDL